MSLSDTMRVLVVIVRPPWIRERARSQRDPNSLAGTADQVRGATDLRRSAALTTPLQQRVEVLDQARGLVAEAHGRAYPQVEDSGSLLVVGEIHRRLAGPARPDRLRAGWSAILATARALAFRSDSIDYWTDFANVLITAGRYRAADVVARLARLARIRTPPTTGAWRGSRRARR